MSVVLGKRWVECRNRAQISIPDNLDTETQVILYLANCSLIRAQISIPDNLDTETQVNNHSGNLRRAQISIGDRNISQNMNTS